MIYMPRTQLAIFVCCQLFALHLQSQQIDPSLLKSARRGWEDIENKNKQYTGRIEGRVDHGSLAKRPPNQVVEFQINGKLEKQTERSESNGEETLKLWGKSGNYVLRRPSGQRWMIASVGGQDSWSHERATVGCLRAVTVWSARLLYLTESSEHRVTRFETLDPNDAVLEIEFLGKFASIEPNQYPLGQTDRPQFDKAEIHLDPQHNFRITSYKIERSHTNAWLALEICRVRNTYEDVQVPYIPTRAYTTYESEDGKKVFTKVDVKLDVQLEIVPESEFTLEHYGLITPMTERSNSWWPLLASVLACVFFVALAVRFFRRR